MVSSVKRKFGVDGDVEREDSLALHKLKKYQQRLSDGSKENLQRTFRHLKRLLLDSKDDEKFVKYVKESFDQHVVANILILYNATKEKNDLKIFDILQCFERTYHINLRCMAPIVFGEKSKENYENLRRFGQTLRTRLSSDQVLDFLDAGMMWNSLLKFSDSPSSSYNTAQNKIYDPRFILRLLVSILDAGAEISCRKFIDVNALSFAFAATSLYSSTNRALAYVALRRFYDRLSDLSTESLEEKPLYIYMLSVFRNSINFANQRVSHVVAHFFARISKLLLHPENPMYQPLLSFLVLKPTIDLDNVPEFYKLFMSSSTEYHEEERQWVLRLVADSFIEPNDYNILQKRFVIKYCLACFTSCLSDQVSRRYILFILSSALKHPSVAQDLFQRHNLLCWITTTVQQPWVPRWEVCFLCQLFVKLLIHFDNGFSKVNEIIGTSTRVMQRQMCLLLCKKTLEVLNKEEDEGKSLWSDKLFAFINGDIIENLSGNQFFRRS